MNKCLYCYQDLDLSEMQYHAHCAKKLFGTKGIPQLNISSGAIEKLAHSVINKQISVPGVQKKLSLNIDTIDETTQRFTIVGIEGDYILKPPFERYPYMPEVEDLSMHLAEIAGIKVVPHALIPLKDGELCYITKRIDRGEKGQKYAMEDFCQLCERLASDKYKGSYEQIAKKLNEHSSAPILDLVNYWEIVLFSWIIGNSDMHLKNFSLISHSMGKYQLSPAYDLLSVKLVYPEDDEELALALQGKKKKLRKKHFVAAMQKSLIPDKTIEKMFSKFLNVFPEWMQCIDHSFLPVDYQTRFKDMIHERIKHLA